LTPLIITDGPAGKRRKSTSNKQKEEMGTGGRRRRGNCTIVGRQYFEAVASKKTGRKNLFEDGSVCVKGKACNLLNEVDGG